MSLSPGTRLASYEVISAIGAGGMGEVFRARDTKLNRDVAIKVLPAAFADDPERLARFTREAQTLASLNHPNIATIFGIEEVSATEGSAGGSRALVMELIEGEDLSDHIARGPIPIAEALPIARQIAEALEAAHEQGIVHRDLKPGNIKVTPDGRVKVLDFGLAKAMDPSGASSPNVSHSPTLTHQGTMAGMIIGTAAYMAPEQAKGKAVDKRADIWAFGVVLYEMLTGKRLFRGEDVSDTLAAVLRQDIDFAALPTDAPPSVRRLVARCLERDLKRRLRDIGEARVILDNPTSPLVSEVTSGSAARISAADAPPPVSERAQLLRVGIGIAGGALVAALAVGWMMRPKPTAPAVVARFEMELPEGQDFTRTGRHTVALSPDGRHLVYVANRQLYLRAMHELSATPISGTEGLDPAEPVFSPDGQWLAFWSNDQLRKVPVTGGTPVALCAAQAPHGASWSGDRIFLGQERPSGIVEVEANGGTPKLVVTLDEKKNELAHGPQLIAGGRAMLFTQRTGPGSWDDAAIVVQNLSTGERKVLVSGGRDAKVLPSRHLVYSRDGTLFAMPFDEATLSTTGGAAPVQEEVLPGVGLAAMQIAFSASGSLALVPGTGLSSYELAWVDRQGREDRLPAPPRNYGTTTGSAPFDVSPDGTKLAVRINDRDRTTTGRSSVPAPANTSQAAPGNDIWIFDIPRGTLTRLTFNGNAGYPVWTRDGRRVCYSSSDEEFCQAADGTGSPQLLVKVKGLVSLKSFSPDGKQAVLTVRDPKTGFDVVTTTTGPPVETRPLIQTAYLEHSGVLSPDGRFLAYASNETGRLEVYVRPYPSVDQGRWQISIEGGAEPRWAGNSRELFFSNFGGGVQGGLRPDEPAILSVAVQPGPAFVAGRPGVVVKRPEAAEPNYDVAPDGRFLFVVRPKSVIAERPRIVVVQNWFEELKTRVTAGKK